MKKAVKRLTFEKYYEIARKMRESGDYTLDISKYEPQEVAFITELIKNDSIYQFVEETKHIDIRKLEAYMEYLDAQEKMYEARAKF